MIPKRNALLVVPWGLVVFLVIGCSKQEAASNRTAREWQDRQVVTAISKPATDADREAGSNPQQQYLTLVASNVDNPVVLAKALATFYEGWGTDQGEAAVGHAMTQNRALVRHAFAGWLG
jgi:hypothetical protein